MFKRIYLRLRDFSVDDDSVRVGERVFALADIRGIRVERDDLSGATAYRFAIVGYLAVAMAFVIPVMGGHLSPKFLFVAAVSGGIGLSLLQDLIGMPGKLMFRLWLALPGRDELVFFAQGEGEITKILSVLEPLTRCRCSWSETITPVTPVAVSR